MDTVVEGKGGKVRGCVMGNSERSVYFEYGVSVRESGRRGWS